MQKIIDIFFEWQTYGFIGLSKHSIGEFIHEFFIGILMGFISSDFIEPVFLT